jgi:hypothetical protein
LEKEARWKKRDEALQQNERNKTDKKKLETAIL